MKSVSDRTCDWEGVGEEEWSANMMHVNVCPTQANSCNFDSYSGLSRALGSLGRLGRYVREKLSLLDWGGWRSHHSDNASTFKIPPIHICSGRGPPAMHEYEDGASQYTYSRIISAS